MPKVDVYTVPNELLLGTQKNDRVPRADQDRQRSEVEEILSRLRSQPGVILADEVGMGKTFVALAVAYCVAAHSRRGPVIVMVPPNLVDKWEQDLETFCELYVASRRPVSRKESTSRKEFRSPGALRYGVARHSVDLMKLLDDPPRERCHLIFLAQGAMGRRQSDKWVRLALIREALRRHGRRQRLKKVRRHIHRFMAELLWAIGEENASDWGDELWQALLRSDPMTWKERYNQTVRNERRRIEDDPVPESVVKALHRVDLARLADALEEMPVRESQYTSERIGDARSVLRDAEQNLWAELLAAARWRSPLLVMDEAHHLKNPSTNLARQLQSPDSDSDLRTGHGAMARSFERMLFLTATPFQLGHQELVRVLERFGDVRWHVQSLGQRDRFDERLAELGKSLTESQRAAVALQRNWTRLRPEDGPADGDPDGWWQSLRNKASDDRTPRQRALVDAFTQAQESKAQAESQLRRWLIRHNKGEVWSGTNVRRRCRSDGAAIIGDGHLGAGLEVPPNQLLPFFLAARSAVSPGQDILGDALCSSYEAFRYTRENRATDRDQADDDEPAASVDVAHAAWYLGEFDVALKRYTGNIHPKVVATVQKAVDLWEAGEKVLVFAFYRHTCRALRLHISQEIERRINTLARRRFAGSGRSIDDGEIERVLQSIQDRYYDDTKRPGRKALDRALHAIVRRRHADLEEEQQERLLEVMRRFLRVPTTLVRCFPIHRHDTRDSDRTVAEMLDEADHSGVSWRAKFEGFIDFLIDRCSSSERGHYLEAAARTQTGGIRVEAEYLAADDDDEKESAVALANVQIAMGTTRRDQRSRLMRAFNTPFFPDILVCSEVMGEGVDLHRYCRHVIHHDLAWNPSTIEQRTGRIDRLGCKAEAREASERKMSRSQPHPIHVFLPYLSGTADERQYRVMTDREQWFRIVMGQDEVAKLIPKDEDRRQSQLPKAFSQGLTFDLGCVR